MLASASNAIVVGFNVRPNAEARALAEREGVEIRTYRVIYQLTEDIEQALVGMLSPVQTEETLGEAEVRALFRVSRLGTIAGCMVTSGVVRRNAQVRVVRDGTVIYETTIAQLKRFKDDAREVQEGFECGILLDGFNDVKEGDVLEVYETREVERTDLSAPPPPSVAAAGGLATEPGRTRDGSGHGHRLRRHPLGRAALPREPLAEGEAAASSSRRRRSSRTASAPRSPRSTTTTLWQRARLTLACVAREHREAERLLDEAERYLVGQECELASSPRRVSSTTERSRIDVDRARRLSTA